MTPKPPTLIKGGVASQLARMALPMLVAIISMAGFNLVDTYFVGQLGTKELAAMSFTFPIVMVVMSISMGIGVGTTSAISKAIGRNDQHRIQRLATDAISLGLTIAVVVMVVGLLTIRGLFGLLGAEGEILDLTASYMWIWYLGIPVVVIPQVSNAGIRATGDTKTPATIMVTAMVVNIVLDPLLIFGLGPFPELGLQGAAIATVLARAAALVMAVWILAKRENMLLPEMPRIAEAWASWKEIVHVGLPAALAQLIQPVSTGVITRLVAGFGIAAVAGYGVATRLELFAVMTVFALGGALIPFVGQNWGAGEVDRVRLSVRYSNTFAMLWGAAMWIIILVAGKPIVAAFNSDPVVIATGYSYLLIVGASYGLQGVLLVTSQAFNAVRKPIPSMLLSLTRMLFLYVPLALAGAHLIGLVGIWWAALVSSIVTGVAAVPWFTRTLNRMWEKRSASPEAVTEPAQA